MKPKGLTSGIAMENPYVPVQSAIICSYANYESLKKQQDTELSILSFYELQPSAYCCDTDAYLVEPRRFKVYKVADGKIK